MKWFRKGCGYNGYPWVGARGRMRAATSFRVDQIGHPRDLGYKSSRIDPLPLECSTTEDGEACARRGSEFFYGLVGLS